MAKRKKAKRQIWKKFKSKIIRRRSVVVGVITVGISVAVLAIFVPSDPAAMVTNINNNGLSLSVKAPGTVAFNKPVKFTMKIKNTSKKTIYGAAIQMQPGNVVVAGSCGGCEKSSPSGSPNGLATWSVNGLKKGKTRTINVTMKFNQGGTWKLLWTVVKGSAKSQNQYINVKPPPKPDHRLSVAITGVPTKITLNKQYTYTITIKNTGKKSLSKVNIWYSNGFNVKGSSMKFTKLPKPDATVNWYEIRWTLTNLKAGATKRITIKTIYTDSSNGAEAFAVRAKGMPSGSAQVLKQGWY